MAKIRGHHHISMMTKNANENNYFYKNILGLRRVKMTVNQDDPSMYHLFYGDQTGSPGTELTFFEMPAIGQTYRGTNAITRIGLVVRSKESLIYWKRRFEQFDVKHGNITTFGHRSALHFEDIDGLRLVLVVSDEQLTHFKWWEKSPVPEKHAIQGMGPIEITVRRLNKLRRTLTDLFHYEVITETDDMLQFQSVKGGVYGEIIAKQLDGQTERPGRGSVHHLAIRVKDEAELQYWDEKVRKRGFHSTGVLDRFYFKSLYFRESNGIMFEIATDGPGFTVDGDIATLGESLDLPPFLEDQRSEIIQKLTPIKETL